MSYINACKFATIIHEKKVTSKNAKMISSLVAKEDSVAVTPFMSDMSVQKRRTKMVQSCVGQIPDFSPPNATLRHPSQSIKTNNALQDGKWIGAADVGLQILLGNGFDFILIYGNKYKPSSLFNVTWPTSFALVKSIVGQFTR